MTMDARRAIGVGAVVCAIVAPLVALRLRGVIGAAPGDRDIRSSLLTQRRDAQQTYATATFRSLADAVSADDVRLLLETGFVENHAAVAGGRIDLLRSHAAEFLFERFVQPDGSRYVQWRAESGYRPRSRDGLFANGPIGRIHIAITTSDDPMAPSDQEVADRLADVPTDAMFVAAWNHGVGDRGGSGTPERVATSPDWIGLSVSRAVSPKGGGRPVLEGKHGMDLWYGTSAASPLQWWEPPASQDDLRELDGKLILADVGVLARFADESFKPIVCTFAWDERSARWWLLHMTIQNSQGPIAGISY